MIAVLLHCDALVSTPRQQRPPSHADVGLFRGKSATLTDKIYSLISFRKSTPPQNSQLDVLISNSKQHVDGLVVELTFNPYLNGFEIGFRYRGVGCGRA